MGAVPEGGCVDELANEVDAFVRPAGEVLGLEAGADVGSELVVPAARKAGLQGAGLDGLDAGDGLDQHGLVFCTAGKLDIEPPAQDGHHGQAQAKVQGQADQHDEGQRHAVEQHDGHEEDGEHHVQQHGEGVAGEEAADVFQLAHAGHRVAHAPRLEVRQGQLHEVSEQPRAQFHINAAGGVAEDVGAQGVEQALEHHNHHQADDQYVQGGQAAVHQDFVHDDLEEQRADQRKELQHEGDEQHFAQQLAVFDEAGDEPGEVELGQLARQAGAAGDEDEFAAPVPGELLQRFDGGPAACVRGCRVLQQHALAVALGQYHGAWRAVVRVQYCQGRQGRQGQPLWRGARAFGFEAQVPGRAQDVGGARCLAGLQAKLVGQCCRVGCRLVEPCHQAQGCQGVVGVGGWCVGRSRCACWRFRRARAALPWNLGHNCHFVCTFVKGACYGFEMCDSNFDCN